MKETMMTLGEIGTINPIRRVVVADAGSFVVNKPAWNDVGLKRYAKWSRIMGYVLTHKRTGARVAWFRDVGSALVCADQLKEVVGEEQLEAIEHHYFPHPEGYATVVRWKEIMGDPK